MCAADAQPLWRQVVRQSLCGARGLTKTGTIWFGLAFPLSVSVSGRWPPAWVVCLLVFTASSCRTVASILANDLADRADDAGAGKDRWIARLPLRLGVAITSALFLAGIGIASFGRAPWPALVAYAAASLLGVLYSIRPARLKVRGLYGLAGYAACGVLSYAALPGAWLGIDATLLGIVAVPVFLDRWVMLHFHQVVDYDADRAGALGTYAVRAGLVRARRTLRWAAWAASAALAGALVFVVVAAPWGGTVAAVVALAAAAAAALHARRERRRAEHPSVLSRELPGLYLGLTLAVFRVLPPLLLARRAFDEPAMWVPTALCGGLMLADILRSARYRYR